MKIEAKFVLNRFVTNNVIIQRSKQSGNHQGSFESSQRIIHTSKQSRKQTCIIHITSAKLACGSRLGKFDVGLFLWQTFPRSIVASILRQFLRSVSKIFQNLVNFGHFSG